jgi:prophage regulatory protein
MLEQRTFRAASLPAKATRPLRKTDSLETESVEGLQDETPTPIAILDEPQVRALTSLSRTTRWRMERRGEFPKRVRLSPGRVGWRQADIEVWIGSRAA